MSKLVGLGFDGYSTMSGKENSVQTIIRKKYPIASYFHIYLILHHIYLIW